jgi:hypothetical protein
VRYLSIFFEIKDLIRQNPSHLRCFDGSQAVVSEEEELGNEKSDHKLSVSLTGTESFLTESLILAQNERWRRG